jgi:hypothetical protein
MSVRCEIQFPNDNQTQTVDLTFEISPGSRPQVILNNQLGFLENPKGTRVYHEPACKTIWFTIIKTG